jgi:hypothetical protein
MSGITDCNCLSGKELTNSLPDKLKSMVYKTIQSRLFVTNRITDSLFCFYAFFKLIYPDCSITQGHGEKRDVFQRALKTN